MKRERGIGKKGSLYFNIFLIALVLIVGLVIFYNIFKVLVKSTDKLETNYLSSLHTITDLFSFKWLYTDAINLVFISLIIIVVLIYIVYRFSKKSEKRKKKKKR